MDLQKGVIMAYWIDSHLHTCFSEDSDTPAEVQIEKAISLGMPAICITDHQDFEFPDPRCTFYLDTEPYFEKLLALKEVYKKRIDLRIGVEIGLQTGIQTDLKAYADRYPFDFIIGSNHVCMGVDPYYPDLYERVPESLVYETYFKESLENLKAWDCFDVAGHLDYIVRYGPTKNEHYSYRKYADLIDEILKIIIGRGMGIECNTSGLKAGLGQPNPCSDIFKRYLELGGEIVTLASDAHVPEYVGYRFDLASQLLKECGVRYYAAYKNRKPEFFPL